MANTNANTIKIASSTSNGCTEDGRTWDISRGGSSVGYIESQMCEKTAMGYGWMVECYSVCLDNGNVAVFWVSKYPTARKALAAAKAYAKANA